MIAAFLWVNLVPQTDFCIYTGEKMPAGQFHHIIVTSVKGGIGKSTVALGTASALARRGRRVLLIDCDTGNRCLDLMLGMEDSVLFDLGDLCEGRAAPSDVLLTVPRAENFLFCAAPDHILDEAAVQKLPDALRALTEESGAEFVICDTAGCGSVVQRIAADFADGAFVIAAQQPASIRAAEKTAVLMDTLGRLTCRLVISGFEERAAEDGTRAGLLDIIDGSRVQTIGVVPKDRTLMLRQEQGKLPDARSRAGTAFCNIATRLCGEEIRLFAGIRKIRTDRVL